MQGRDSFDRVNIRIFLLRLLRHQRTRRHLCSRLSRPSSLCVKIPYEWVHGTAIKLDLTGWTESDAKNTASWRASSSFWRIEFDIDGEKHSLKLCYIPWFVV